MKVMSNNLPSTHLRLQFIIYDGGCVSGRLPKMKSSLILPLDLTKYICTNHHKYLSFIILPQNILNIFMKYCKLLQITVLNQLSGYTTRSWDACKWK